MPTIQSKVYTPEIPEYLATLESLRGAADVSIDAIAETTAAYTALRKAVLDLLAVVDYTTDPPRGYDVRVRDLVSAAHALRRLDALTGGGR